MARRPALLALLSCVVLFAACSSSANSPSTTDGSVTTSTSAPTTPATSNPATSTTATSTTATSTTATSTTATSVVPESTAAPTSAPAATPAVTAPAPATTAPLVAPVLYSPAPSPATPDVTHAVDPAWVQADGTLTGVVDGSYWAVAEGTGDAPQKYVNLRIVQAFFGDACRAQFGSSADACRNDYGTLETPTGTVKLFVGTAAVTVSDPATQESYAIDVEELHRLLAAPPGTATPGANAPAGFIFVPFAFLVRVAGGQIVLAEQVWTP